MNEEIKPGVIFKATDGSYRQIQGKVNQKIFTPVQVAAIKQIMQDDVKEKTQLYIRSRGFSNE